MVKLAHIINPVKVNESSDLHVAQPVTFRTMLKAKEYSTLNKKVNLYAVGYEEDVNFIPKGFKILPNLINSVMDYGNFQNRRKLPLIADILNSCTSIDTDYIIYTNADISLQPYFYDYIFHKIHDGSDSLIINRRIVDEFSSDVVMFSEVGLQHPGFDCFVFRKELLRKFNFGNACIGANWIGRILYTNLLIHSKSLEIIKDAHLTFHIGEDGAWMQEEYSEFDLHNKREVSSIIKNQLLEVSHDQDLTSKLNDTLFLMDSWDKPKLNINSSSHDPKKLKVPNKIKNFVKLFFK
jgi:hypothetical protein